MDTLRQDLAFALRGLVRVPAMRLAILCLALGLGINVTAFSAVHDLVVAPLPFENPDDLVVVGGENTRLESIDAPLTWADVRALRRLPAFAGVEALDGRSFTLSDRTGAERVIGAVVTPGLFRLLGEEPLVGRHFLPEEAAEAGFEGAAIISHALWQRRFAEDAEVLDRTLVVNGRAIPIVGVMPPGFAFPEGQDVWLPLGADDEGDASRRFLTVVARLAPGTPVESARVALGPLSRELEATFPDSHRRWALSLEPARARYVGEGERRLLLLALGGVGLVLLIAVANVANLVVARGVDRGRELAVREAMGASRQRLLRQFLAEAALVTAAGLAGGVLLAWWWIDLVAARMPADLPYWVRIDMEPASIWYGVLLSLPVAAVVGLLPALGVGRRPAFAGGLRTGGGAERWHGPFRAALAAGEVALSLALLTGAGLLGRSALEMMRTEIGVREEGVLSFRMVLSGDAYDPVAARLTAFAGMTDALTALPEVEGVAFTTAMPADDGGSVRRISRVEGDEDAELVATVVGWTPGFMEPLDVRLLSGRPFDRAEGWDTASAVALAGSSLARRLWGDGAVPGESLVVEGLGEVTVVGIVSDVQYEELGEETTASRLQLHVPLARLPSRQVSVMVAGRGVAPAVAPVREALGRVDPLQAPFDILPMEARRAFTTSSHRTFGILFVQFGAVSLLLTLAGIYGIMAYEVGRRRRELGIRMALGATGRSVTAGVLRRALGVIGVGLAVGLSLALLGTRGLQGLLYRVPEHDPLVFIGVPLGLLVVALTASFVPARRAARTDPVEVLREE